jgi:hypothetical protein
VLIADHSLAICNLVKRPLNARYAKDKKSCGEFAIKMACSKVGENAFGNTTVWFSTSWPKDPRLKTTNEL